MFFQTFNQEAKEKFFEFVYNIANCNYSFAED